MARAGSQSVLAGYNRGVVELHSGFKACLGAAAPMALIAGFLAGCSDSGETPSSATSELPSSSEVRISHNLAIPTTRESRAPRILGAWGLGAAAIAPTAAWTYSGPPLGFPPSGGLTVPNPSPGELTALLGEGRATPRFTIALDAALAQLDTVELDAVVPQSCTAEIVLRFDQGPDIVRQFRIPGSPAVQTIPLPLGWLERPWSGVRELELRPDIDRPQLLNLVEIRLLRNGLALGVSPTGGSPFWPPGIELMGQPAADFEAQFAYFQDIGLVGPGRDLKRGFAQQTGASLTLQNRLSPKARICISAIPSWQAHRTKGEWHAAIIATSALGEPRILTQVDLDLDRLPGLPEWVSLSCELPSQDEANQSIEFFAWSGAKEMPDDSFPSRSDWKSSPNDFAAIWGAPFQASTSAKAPRPNIVLVTLDTTRADQAYDPDTAPFLAKLRGEGTSFERAWSAANTTGPSHASLFTGLPVHAHGAFTNGVYPLDENLNTLAERFRDAGYRTMAAVSVEHLGSAYKFSQGFDVFLDPPTTSSSGVGADTLARIAPWLDELQGEPGSVPFFLWVHLFDPHGPYGVPPGAPDEFRDELDQRGLGLPAATLKRGDLPTTRIPPTGLVWLDGQVNSAAHLRAKYRRGVAYADHLTGQLFGMLESRELMQDTIFAVTADHGESLGEQDFWGTHASLYPAVMQVPLILHGPGIPKHIESARAVSTLDIAPTLARLAGLEAADRWVGHSVSPGLQQDWGWMGIDLLEPSSGDLLAEREIWFEAQTLAQVGRLEGDQLFIANIAEVNMGLRPATAFELERAPYSHYSNTFAKGDFELYSLSSDEQLNDEQSDSRSAVAQALDKRVRAWVTSGLANREGFTKQLTPQEEQRLSDLGYTDL